MRDTWKFLRYLCYQFRILFFSLLSHLIHILLFPIIWSFIAILSSSVLFVFIDLCLKRSLHHCFMGFMEGVDKRHTSNPPSLTGIPCCYLLLFPSCFRGLLGQSFTMLWVITYLIYLNLSWFLINVFKMKTCLSVLFPEFDPLNFQLFNCKCSQLFTCLSLHITFTLHFWVICSIVSSNMEFWKLSLIFLFYCIAIGSKGQYDIDLGGFIEVIL